jgi:N-carbamoyl-L-amino-acid hydrolase
VRAIIRGKAAHSGSTPHGVRQDAVMRFVGLMNHIEAYRVELGMDGIDVRVTVGMVSTNTERHGMTTIADEITFSIDVQGTKLATIRRVLRLAQDYGHDWLELGEVIETPPHALRDSAVPMSIANNLGIPCVTIPSSADHDTSVFAGTGIKAGMICVRNQNGNHNPAEAMNLDDFMAALDILYAVVTV